ncbi:MAG: lysozyme [Rickettsiaceae bacterium]
MHRFTNKQGIELIKSFEGLRTEPYVCAGGYLTIGYGHRLLPSDSYKKISPEKAVQILANDLCKVERSVLKYINAEINDDQFAALVSFTFNVGAAALQRSVLRQKINYGHYDDGAKEFLKWVYAGGRKITGLVRRRRLESELFSGIVG